MRWKGGQNQRMWLSTFELDVLVPFGKHLNECNVDQ